MSAQKTHQNAIPMQHAPTISLALVARAAMNLLVMGLAQVDVNAKMVLTQSKQWMKLSHVRISMSVHKTLLAMKMQIAQM